MRKAIIGSYAFGTVTGIPGDINHDGYDDVIVGCQLGTLGIYVYYGSESGPNEGVNGDLQIGIGMPDQPSIRDCSMLFLPGRLAAAGDINGDGVDDVAASRICIMKIAAIRSTTPGRIWAYYSSAGVIEGTVTYTDPAKAR